MSTTGSLTMIDDYLDALLDNAPGPSATHAPAAQLAKDAHADAHESIAAAPPAPGTTLAASVESTPTIAPAPAFAATPPTTARPTSTLSSNRWLRVTVGGDSYALELLRVQEVVRLAPIVGMRGARPAVQGVMNLRGRIVPVFDLGLWLGTTGVKGDERSRIVVVERDDELIGVLVSAVEDVVTLGRDRIEPPLIGSAPGAILGVARVGAAPTVLLDADALFGA